MESRYVHKVVEVLPDRLYWISDSRPPEDIKNAFYFCVDKELKYAPYFSDFGPFNIAQVARFATELDKLLVHEKYRNNVIFHYTGDNAIARTNAAFIMGAYMVG